MKTYNWLNRNRPLSRLRFATAGAIDLITKNVSIRELVNRSPRRRGFLLIPLLLGCFALSPRVQAVGPDTDGAIAGSNNGEGVGVLVSRTTGVWNTGAGFDALNHLTSGSQNTATGLRALFSDTSGGQNTATGAQALYSNTTGVQNTANGWSALYSNTAGSYNTANGWSALNRNTTGYGDTATGIAALFRNTTGYYNTANGNVALYSNTTGNSNTATGVQALYSNTTGNANTANGARALQANTIGFGNTASGFVALLNSTGGANTADGAGALQSNTSGFGNVASGYQALNGNTTGLTNTALGYQAGINCTTGSNNVYIGAGMGGFNGESNACYIASIFGQTTAFGGLTVYIDSNGRLGTNPSSKRFKEHIKPMDKASEALLALKPVTFRYKSDAKGRPQFGLIAEEVAEVNPDLVVRDKDGKIYSVRYDQVNAMLLNEFLKEHRTVQEQGATIAELKKEIASLITDVNVQAAQIQKVSAQLEARNPAPQMAFNNQ